MADLMAVTHRCGIQRWADLEVEPNEELSIAVKIATPDGNSAKNEILTF